MREKLADFARQQLTALLGGTAIAVLGVLSFWLSPLKEIVLQRLYPERAEVAVIADHRVISAGEAIEIQVKISQRSAFPVGKGVAYLHFDHELLALPADAISSINTGEISGVTTLDKRFVLVARPGKTGKAELHATLQTKFNTYTSKPVTVEVSPRREATAPFIEQHGSQALNLSGEWRIEIGMANGRMAILQDGQSNIKGTYELEGAEGAKKLVVDGYKDGTSFKVFFYRNQEGSRRWRVDANFAVNQSDRQFVEIKGCAYSIVSDSTVTEDSVEEGPEKGAPCARTRSYVGWKGSGSSTFYATAQMAR